MRTEEITRITERVLARLDLVNSARERALAETRQITRLSANAVRAVHRGEFDQAEAMLEEARRIKDALTAHLVDYPSIYWSGYVQDAHKEFAEASLTLALVAGQPLPGPETLQVEDAVYLNALGEACGELRRHIMDVIRAGDLARAEAVLQVMDEIYGVLVQVDYPDAVTNGLRRTTDMVRGVLERTRGDLTLAVEHQKLSDALARARRAVGLSEASQ
ncbi:haloacid dehalogenase [Thermomicrobium sp. CFH 73360]|uniref:haloacid dehalogenase n=1 Tax=Thermomicrobium sp. CFH 73360 TaxID=2951987 RepID=UPI00207797B6|nr:haloacid dehalogenase [Thermomicrobium sp. CFH 73360]MCM8745798.1 haloacid dehalogenase [Thermomicrobium sp. CFH 73360]